MFGLTTPLSRVSSISPRFLKNLERLGIKTVKDLVWHFPNRYEDFSQIYQIADLEPGQQATISGIIREVKLRRSFRRHMAIVEAVIDDGSGTIRGVWFNQPYLKNTLRPGRMMNFSGKVSVSENDIYLSHPDYEAGEAKDSHESRHTGRLVPIYPETKGLSSRALRFILQPVLKNLATIPEFLPPQILKSHGLLEISEAIQKIHFPDSAEEVDEIKKRFAFQDLFLLQLFNLEQKLKLAKEKAPKIETDIEYLKEILTTLPFELTTSQKKSLWEIIQDFIKPQPMNRLLQGDVGSGKTVVAALAAFMTTKAGFQAAFMAPTEVLANQHFETIKKLFARMEEKIAGSEIQPLGILTSSGAKIFFPDLNLEKNFKKTEAQKKIQSGEIKIAIGTHSLIQKTVKFKKLGLIIIDEQHRFGVKQRNELISQSGETGLVPHFLSMSATPIPRTLMLTVFGDLDVSIINEQPKGRKVIETKIIPPEGREEAYQFIREQVKQGRQAFVICPRIEKRENSESGIMNYAERMQWEVRSVKEEHEKLSTQIFPDLKVGMLHGQIKAKQKEEIMNNFRTGKIQVLVSTSVIEVGVDVPNAVIMMIEGADRFGLAQLYQFRGRVGRGAHQSYCFLFTDSEAKSTQDRLKAIVEARSGFELAEMDLKLRGPGEFLGQAQAGLPDLAMQALQNPELIKFSREAAVEIIKKDTTLKKYPLIREKLIEFQKKVHQE